MQDQLHLLDQSGLVIKECGRKKGRGVVATRPIPARTLIDISPILLFPTQEYHDHGRHTLLDHYTYRWQGGMALALGLGSMFNHHSKHPNVGFQRDFENKLIRYSTLREIQAGEELYISYGPNLWFGEESDNESEGTEEDAYVPASDISSEDESENFILSKLQIVSDED